MIEVPVLSSSDILDLLRRIIGPQRTAQAPQDADMPVQLCGGLLLAVRLAGAKLAARPHGSLHQLVTRLSNTRSSLDHLGHARLHGGRGVHLRHLLPVAG
ncbi:hypothetical protein [Nonomuraea sp. GTA35]|uniref:hypothetical protein n=1 Tax=Nonomuraea sp. GTA35 TaxID=1676746 RepID=UPI0035BFC70B